MIESKNGFIYVSGMSLKDLRAALNAMYMMESNAVVCVSVVPERQTEVLSKVTEALNRRLSDVVVS